MENQSKQNPRETTIKEIRALLQEKSLRELRAILAFVKAVRE